MFTIPEDVEELLAFCRQDPYSSRYILKAWGDREDRRRKARIRQMVRDAIPLPWVR
jgi:hypothetical protein